MITPRSRAGSRELGLAWVGASVVVMAPRGSFRAFSLRVTDLGIETYWSDSAPLANSSGIAAEIRR
jgi:hypothetical protein